ncbi:hypothetical protein BJ165DRAFT_1406851 [Panaeolus papilionaceus]|nr:hypothetical protein BJ165DRAFT_1406851 [Panaeolus papilionaceus]
MIEDEQIQFRSRNYASYYLTTLRFELNNIWRTPFGLVNLLYLASRYLGLIPQIVHYVLIHIRLANPPVDEARCKRWIISLLANATLLLLILDTVQFLRIYALYKKRKWVFCTLVPIFTQALAIGRAMRRVYTDTTLDGLCNIEGSMVNATSISSTVLFTHILLWLITFCRRNIAQGRALVVKLVVRESTWAVVLLFGLFCTIIPYASIKRHISPFFALAWGISFLSITCCRQIMNIRSLQVEQSPDEDAGEQLILTTIITTSDIYAVDHGSDLECEP